MSGYIRAHEQARRGRYPRMECAICNNQIHEPQTLWKKLGTEECGNYINFCKKYHQKPMMFCCYCYDIIVVDCSKMTKQYIYYYTKNDLERISKENKDHPELFKQALEWLVECCPQYDWSIVKDFPIEFTDKEYLKFRNLIKKKGLYYLLKPFADCYDWAIRNSETSNKIVYPNHFARCGKGWSYAVTSYYCYILLIPRISKNDLPTELHVGFSSGNYPNFPEPTKERLGIRD